MVFGFGKFSLPKNVYDKKKYTLLFYYSSPRHTTSNQQADERRQRECGDVGISTFVYLFTPSKTWVALEPKLMDGSTNL